MAGEKNESSCIIKALRSAFCRCMDKVKNEQSSARVNATTPDEEKKPLGDHS